MNKFKFLTKLLSAPLLLIVGVSIAIVAVGSIFLLTTNSKQNQNRPPLKPDHRLSYVGSIGTGSETIDSGIASFKKNYQNLDEVTLYWYDLDSGGGISRDDNISDQMEEDIIGFAKLNRKRIFVGIGDHGEAEKADDILTDSDKQKDHISKIISLLNEKGYDGVIIDYEDLKADQEKDFTKYMSKISEELHSKGKSLGISTPVETTGSVFHGINIADVSKSVDRMHLVAYEEFGEGTEPGPIASIDWVNAILSNVVDQGVDPSKIVLGTAHSGHDWITSHGGEFFKDTTTKEVLSISSEKNADLKWDEITQSSFFEYKDEEGHKHVVWLEDSRSFKAKIDLAKSYELQGVFIWYLGGEDPQIFESL